MSFRGPWSEIRNQCRQLVSYSRIAGSPFVQRARSSHPLLNGELLILGGKKRKGKEANGTGNIHLGFTSAFIWQHQEEFDFTLDRGILVDDVRARALGKTRRHNFETISQSLNSVPIKALYSNKSIKKTKFYTDGAWCEAYLCVLDDLASGDLAEGLAVILDQTQTILAQPGWPATFLPSHLALEKTSQLQVKSFEEDENYIDLIQLSVFGHRFMSTADQMGNSLEKTGMFINTKERLKYYSCAIFLSSGGLVANAPHISCQLGAMSSAVAYQAEL
ncbi:hypothetical protein NM208_g13116 [Fusarium decemcellulare]|uniref:Uncharacterized protein n=1 Tax=Fusarium decemcellulare TaxID=57161 RepID=A0ACC1RKZ4_9HYPO|nr:hypothetical protein NM208_g13116 [Fusarium decemcellulare]